MIDQIDTHRLKKANLLILALAHPVKRKLITIIDNQTLSVGEIMDKIQLKQPIISQHLATLRRYKVVTTKRKGRFILYSLNKEKLAETNNWLKKLP